MDPHHHVALCCRKEGPLCAAAVVHLVSQCPSGMLPEGPLAGVGGAHVLPAPHCIAALWLQFLPRTSVEGLASRLQSRCLGRGRDAEGWPEQLAAAQPDVQLESGGIQEQEVTQGKQDRCIGKQT